MDTLLRCSVYGTLNTLLKHRNTKACIHFKIYTERVHASHPYRAVDVTMALRSLTSVFIEVALILSSRCNFANADVAMASLDFTFISDPPSSVI